jgi:3-oxocholest-4-en-26-oyl-CoA dehydrogenase beta subunit
MVDISPTSEQLAFQEAARDFLSDSSPLAAVREAEKSELGYSPEVWRGMVDLDWLRMGHPERVGGLGGGLLDLALLYIEMGRTLAETPHLASAVISGGVLASAGSPWARALLDSIFEGTAVVVPALVEEDGSYRSSAIEVTGSARARGLELDGTKLLVPFANSATHFLVAVRTGPGEEGIRLAVVEAGAPGTALERLPNIADYPLYALTLEGVAVSPEQVVGAWEQLAPVLDRAAILRAAQVVGAAERLLDMAVGYAQTREQFGKKIGSYQAVQYLCSDIAIDAQLSRLFVFNAAAAADQGEEFAAKAAMAKAYASRAARRAANRAHEVFAGVGFILDFDIQLFTRRLKHWELDLGDDLHHRERITSALVSAAEAAPVPVA